VKEIINGRKIDPTVQVVLLIETNCHVQQQQGAACAIIFAHYPVIEQRCLYSLTKAL
jgi:hypothetical protein